MFEFVAWGLVDGATGNLLAGRGATSTRIAVGRYEIALSNDYQLDELEMMMSVITNQLGTARTVNITAQTDTVKTIQLRNPTTTAGQDSTFYFKIERLKIL